MTDIPKDLREMANHLWDVEYRINVDDDTQTLRSAADEIDRLRAALLPFAEPHAMGDNYVKFAPRLIEAARAALSSGKRGET